MMLRAKELKSFMTGHPQIEPYEFSKQEMPKNSVKNTENLETNYCLDRKLLNRVPLDGKKNRPIPSRPTELR